MVFRKVLGIGIVIGAESLYVPLNSRRRRFFPLIWACHPSPRRTDHLIHDKSSTGKWRIYHWSRENLPLVNSPFTTGEFSFYHW
jgi:hypothetical protein